MVKQPGHLTSIKKERGAGTRVCFFDLVSAMANIIRERRVEIEKGSEGTVDREEGGLERNIRGTYLELMLLCLRSRRRV